MAAVDSPKNMLSVLKEQVAEARNFLEGTMNGVTQDQAAWVPPGRAVPIAAHYAHVLTAMDVGLEAFLKGSAPLYRRGGPDKTGFDQAPPPPGQDWSQWARSTRFDLEGLRRYARAIYESTDKYLSGLADTDLGRAMDLSAMGIGQRSLAWFMFVGWVANPHEHCGEISCLKGLQGLKGYPA